MITNNYEEESTSGNKVSIDPPYFCKIANEAIYQKYNFIQFTECPIIKFLDYE